MGHAHPTRLFKQKYKGGAADLLPVDRTAALLANAEANIPQLERRMGASEVVIADDLIAGALIGRLGEPPGA